MDYERFVAQIKYACRVTSGKFSLKTKLALERDKKMHTYTLYYIMILKGINVSMRRYIIYFENNFLHSYIEVLH